MKQDVVQRAIASTIVWLEGLQESVQVYRFEHARKLVAGTGAGLATDYIEMVIIKEDGTVVGRRKVLKPAGDSIRNDLNDFLRGTT